jgi:hypothetical protein
VLSFATWYGSSPSLSTEQDKTATVGAFPATCAVPSSYGTAGADVNQTVNKTDTILGYTEKTVVDTYVVQGFGPVCVAMNDVQTSYYDYLNNTPFSFVFQSTPLGTSTISELLTLQPGATIKSAGRKAESASGPIASATFAVARAHFDAAIDTERHDRVRALRAYIVRRIESGRKGASAP